MKPPELFSFILAHTTTNWANLPTDENQWIKSLLDFSKELANHCLNKIEDENGYAVDILQDIRDYK